MNSPVDLEAYRGEAGQLIRVAAYDAIEVAGVRVTIRAADGTEEERSFTPEYRDERPNGPDCPPVCRQAAIRWKL